MSKLIETGLGHIDAEKLIAYLDKTIESMYKNKRITWRIRGGRIFEIYYESTHEILYTTDNEEDCLIKLDELRRTH